MVSGSWNHFMLQLFWNDRKPGMYLGKTFYIIYDCPPNILNIVMKKYFHVKYFHVILRELLIDYWPAWHAWRDAWSCWSFPGSIWSNYRGGGRSCWLMIIKFIPSMWNLSIYDYFLFVSPISLELLFVFLLIE